MTLAESRAEAPQPPEQAGGFFIGSRMTDTA